MRHQLTRTASISLLLTLAACTSTPSAAPPAELVEQTDAWHAERVASLTAPDGWLSLVGLEWLEPGPNSVGRADDAQVHYAGFPADSIGTITVTDNTLTFAAAEGIQIGGLPASGRIQSDEFGSPTILSVGDIRFYIVIRGGSPAVRIKDAASPTRTRFTGIDRYPVDQSWKLEAEFIPEIATATVDTVIETQAEVSIIGRARFEVAGTPVDAALFDGGENGCYLRFADATNGTGTYAIGRYLYVDLPPTDGKVTLDFNRAYNPPCAFTPFATCTLPLASNQFPFPVTAGERWDDGIEMGADQ